MKTLDLSGRGGSRAKVLKEGSFDLVELPWESSLLEFQTEGSPAIGNLWLPSLDLLTSQERHFSGFRWPSAQVAQRLNSTDLRIANGTLLSNIM